MAYAIIEDSGVQFKVEPGDRFGDVLAWRLAASR